MKTTKILLSALLAGSVMLFSCQKDNIEPGEKSKGILPSSFKVDIPGSISKSAEKKNLKSDGSDTLQGDEIYEHLINFIKIGESAAEIVDTIIDAINMYNINKAMSLSYTSDDDNRVKNLEVIEDVSFEAKKWEFQMTITDAESETNADEGYAMQIFWNRNPIDGIAFLKPYNIDRSENDDWSKAIFRIDYNEAGQNGYDAHMIVSIDELPMVDPLVDPYAVSELKLFAGKKGEFVDVYGNSNHPNAKFFSDDVGFNWAFAASGIDGMDLGVAEVGLPPSSLDETSRSVLLEDYAIKDVFSDQIYAVWPAIDSASVKGYLHNTDAPGYFDKDGFVQGGTSPGSEYDEIELRIKDLAPYNPHDINNMEIAFKE